LPSFIISDKDVTVKTSAIAWQKHVATLT
jgi:hypothetical protein